MLYSEPVGHWLRCCSVFDKINETASQQMRNFLDRRFKHAGSSAISSVKVGPKSGQIGARHVQARLLLRKPSNKQSKPKKLFRSQRSENLILKTTSLDASTPRHQPQCSKILNKCLPMKHRSRISSSWARTQAIAFQDRNGLPPPALFPATLNHRRTRPRPQALL